MTVLAHPTALTFPYPTPPEPGSVMEIAPGILWLRLALPYRLDHVNVYLIEDGARWAVLDTGLDDADTLWQHAVLGSEDDGESAISRQLSFWTSQLAGLPDQIDLPLDRARPAVSSHRGGSVGLRLSGPLHAGLLELARASGASLFMVLSLF